MQNDGPDSTGCEHDWQVEGINLRRDSTGTLCHHLDKPTIYPRWLIIWFAVSVCAAGLSTIAAPIAHHFASDLWKPAICGATAIAWGSLAGSLLKGEEYATHGSALFWSAVGIKRHPHDPLVQRRLCVGRLRCDARLGGRASRMLADPVRPPAMAIWSRLVPANRGCNSLWSPAGAAMLSGLCGRRCRYVMATDKTTENPWRSAEYDPPSRGRLVEIGRSNSRDEIDALDRLYFYPEAGNWNLVGMLWREVTKCNLINR